MLLLFLCWAWFVWYALCLTSSQRVTSGLDVRKFNQTARDAGEVAGELASSC